MNIIVLLSLIFCLHSKGQVLSTIAEESQWTKTGPASEITKLCRDFARKFPKRVQCKIYGKTPEGRLLHYFLIQEKRQTPIIWVQAGIHAGEIDGKDAVFWLLKDILQGRIKPDPLKGLTLAFIPIVNPDGHERFGKWNRPNQNGPEEMGWRTTAQNLNLNRDFSKIDSSEMQDLIRLWTKLDPILSLDLHATNGAQFQPEVGIIIQPTTHHGKTSLHFAGKKLEEEMMIKLKEKNHLALPFYPSFEDENNPLSGLARYVATPRFSQGYWYNQNRLGMLVETHSWKDYKTRVLTHRNTVLSVLELAQKDVSSWIKAAKEADETSLVHSLVDLEFSAGPKSTIINFPGYKFTIEKSNITGGTFVKYDPSKPEIWKLPFYEELLPTLTVKTPELGYFIPTAYTKWIIPKLKIHDIDFKRWKEEAPQNLETFRASSVEFSPKSFEGHQTLKVKGEWKKEQRSLPNGSIFIPINQNRARLVLQLFEPMAKDSFVSWGFFNTAFEVKEYMENYVAEEVAAEMMKDPKIKKEFDAKIFSEQDFAKDPAKRLNFFYQKHPSFDERLNLYPVYRK